MRLQNESISVDFLGDFGQFQKEAHEDPFLKETKVTAVERLPRAKLERLVSRRAGSGEWLSKPTEARQGREALALGHARCAGAPIRARIQGGFFFTQKKLKTNTLRH